MNRRHPQCACHDGWLCGWCEGRAEDRRERRELGEPLLDRDFDALEAGPWWSSFPGMGSA